MSTPAAAPGNPPPRHVGHGTAWLLLLASLVLAWLFYTISGRDVVLARIVASLPADAKLSWTSAEGPAAGPMTLHGVHFSYHGNEFRAREVMLDPALQPLMWRKLRLDALRIRDAQLNIARSDKPFELPRWPDSLPKIAPPIPVQADDIQIDGTNA